MKLGHVPDIFAILVDRPVRGKLTHPNSVQDRHLRPFLLVKEANGNLILTVDVALIVGKETVGIAVE